MYKKTQNFLLNLARTTLEHYFDTKQKLSILEQDLPDVALLERYGTFVTLHEYGGLRGCIGSIEPIQELYKDVIDNALAAAFTDSRFDPLKKEDLSEIKIEISVLTNPVKLKYSSIEDLIIQLRPNIDGVIIKKGNKSATFLPQVWEDLDSASVFLSSLCEKAELPIDEWKQGKLDVFTYQAEVFRENNETRNR